MIDEPRYLRNSWYVAALTTELAAGALVGRQIVGLPVLLYRDERGAVAAIGNRCPHRFAPLHLGRLEEGQVRCGYHGLGFDRTGQCVHNPHGSDSAVRALRVPAYPAVEQQGLVWVWPGDPDSADFALPPTFECLEGERSFVGFGYLHGNAHYELMSDNILDLSHVEFLHPGLGTEAVSKAKVEVRQVDDRIVCSRQMKNELLPPNLERAYRTGGARVDRAMEVTWQAPAVLRLQVSVEPLEGDDTSVRGSESIHLFTPETSGSTHYFYAGAMNRTTSDEVIANGFFQALRRAFVTEDKPMIDAQQGMMGTTDLMSLRPSLLPFDQAAVLARRRLANLIEAEQAGLPSDHA